jgi:hypothetical protein
MESAYIDSVMMSKAESERKGTARDRGDSALERKGTSLERGRALSQLQGSGRSNSNAELKGRKQTTGGPSADDKRNNRTISNAIMSKGRGIRCVVAVRSDAYRRCCIITYDRRVVLYIITYDRRVVICTIIYHYTNYATQSHTGSSLATRNTISHWVLPRHFLQYRREELHSDGGGERTVTRNQGK